MEIQISSHKHPLLYEEGDGEKGDCNKCAKALSGQIYGCSSCRFYLHEECLELPQELQHFLHPCPLSPAEPELVLCYACSEFSLQKFISFKCQKCDFSLHIRCALAPKMELEDDNVIQHYSHRHPLKLDYNSDSESYCEACGKVCHGPAYACNTCNFFLHESCLDIPREIQHFFHSCPLILMPRASRCDVCLKDNCSLLTYKCGPCYFKMGSRCALMSSTIKSERQDSIEHFSHGHPLLPLEVKEGDRVKCEACNEVCSDLVYGCSGCNFILHKLCAESRKEIRHPFHPQHTLTISCKSTWWTCEGCGKSKIGVLGYCCNECSFHLDFDCARLIPTINYDGHQHFLALFSLPDHASTGKCKLCGGTIYGMYLRCVMCKFNIHLHCYPPIPEKIKHECHIHQLTLFRTRPEEDKADASYKFWCHACEEERNGRDAIYYCSNCRFAAHLKCVISEILAFLTAKEQTVMGSAIGDPSPGKGKEACGDAYAIAKLDRDIAEIRAEVDSLSEEKEKLEVEFTRLQTEIEEISEKIEPRKKRLEELEAERGWHVVMFTRSDKKE